MLYWVLHHRKFKIHLLFILSIHAVKNAVSLCSLSWFYLLNMTLIKTFIKKTPFLSCIFKMTYEVLVIHIFLFGKMLKRKTQVTSSDIRVTSSNSRFTGPTLRVTSSSPRVTSSNLWVAISKLRVPSSNPGAASSIHEFRAQKHKLDD